MDEKKYLQQTRQFFDDLAPNWDSITYHDARKLKLIVDICGPAPGGRLLDIGCGTGVMIGELLEREPRELVAVDISPRMIEQAAQKHHDARLKLVAGDFFTLEESGFDMALLYSVYPHFPHKYRLAHRLAEMLRQGGRFMVAHSEARDTINSRHQGGLAESLSQPLEPAWQEARIWQKYFFIDILADTEQFYLLSGTRK
ncbi:MAG: class I SAM-dependent methyltransferase [Clostridiales bacterium]|nr:class I SAM-dependent methyltransferase [Clostridiales bacterium]